MTNGLAESCTDYEGQLLYFETHCGWGWDRMEEDAPKLSFRDSERGCPLPFHLRVGRFYRHNEALRGAVGIIEEAGHPYNGFWAVFYTRGGFGDLKKKLCLCDILIGPDEPCQAEWDEPEMSKSWPHWCFAQSPQIVGYGMMAASKGHIERDNRRTGMRISEGGGNDQS